ncbi:MAG: saccharopine dehydrogenase NADP-binding domain-containing protein [Burkholderiales bacterium]
MSRRFDVVVFGATGFTGRLVAEYLNASYGVGGELAWALAGRNLDKLAEVRRSIGAGESVPLIVAEATDAGALASLVRQSRAIITTVGPYQLHGRALATACAREGTDYVDLCGEPVWMAQMIPLLEEPARASGARIVFSCGFDSIPFDLGVVFLQDEARRRFGMPLTRVHGRVRRMKGKPSGGTIASMLASIEQMVRDPAARRAMVDPFALTPGFKGARQPESESASYDQLAKAWTGPFIMAPINTKNVHRTNALLGHPWGRDFVYDERMLAGDGADGERRAKRMTSAIRMQNALLAFAPTRALLRRFALPKPGQGPDAKERAAGGYELLFIGQAADGRTLRASVRGEGDPGYASTSRMISESALCLIEDVDRAATGGGVWTPGAAMGRKLVSRLQARAGLTFAIED